jgi:hypothetical protein
MTSSASVYPTTSPDSPDDRAPNGRSCLGGHGGRGGAQADRPARGTRVRGHRAHFGLGRPAQTLGEIGGALGLTAERARQIEVGALDKLRAHSHARVHRRVSEIVKGPVCRGFRFRAEKPLSLSANSCRGRRAVRRCPRPVDASSRVPQAGVASEVIRKPWATHGQAKRARQRLRGRIPCSASGCVERTTGLEPATLTLAKKGVAGESSEQHLRLFPQVSPRFG